MFRGGKVTLKGEKFVREYFSQFDDKRNPLCLILAELMIRAEIVKERDFKTWEKMFGREGVKSTVDLIRDLPPVFRKIKALELTNGQTVSKERIYSDFTDFLIANPDFQLKKTIPQVIADRRSSFFSKFESKFDKIDGSMAFWLIVFHDFLKKKYGIEESTLREWFFKE
jgi:hypothetical protein